MNNKSNISDKYLKILRFIINIFPWYWWNLREKHMQLLINISQSFVYNKS